MNGRTVMQNKLARAIEQIENNEVILSHLGLFLRDVEARLNQLENSVLKMDSAFKTNPITGHITARAVIKVLIEARFCDKRPAFRGIRGKVETDE